MSSSCQRCRIARLHYPTCGLRRTQVTAVRAFESRLKRLVIRKAIEERNFRQQIERIERCWRLQGHVSRLVRETLSGSVRLMETTYRNDPRRIEVLLYDQGLKLFLVLHWVRDLPPNVKRLLEQTFRLFVKLTSGYIESLPPPPDSPPPCVLQHLPTDTDRVFKPIRT